MPTDTNVTPARIASLQIMANRLRRHSLTSAAAAGSGHPTSCMSCAEIMSVLFFHYLRYDVEHPHRLSNDRFLLSKGHAVPILWSALAEAGAFPIEHLQTLRKFDSDLEGHPTPRSPWIDAATGSLGQGLPIAAGMAIAARMERRPIRVFVLMGDGESAEGSVWEAAELASYHQLDNLIAIVDINRLGQSQETMYGHDLKQYLNHFTAFGWHAQSVDGHDVEALIGAFDQAIATTGRPSVILARTLKGKGVSFLENKLGFHGKAITGDELERALRELGDPGPPPEPLALARPQVAGPERPDPASSAVMADPDYATGASVAARKAYGTALQKLGTVEPRVVVLDAEVKNSTHAEDFLKEFPDRYVECFIAEQNMVGMAAGLGAMGRIPFASTFACFLSRAYDFIRMGAISQANLKLCGSHAGVSIGEDGPSQMALEDLAMMRAIHGATVLYPSDAVSMERMVQLAASTPGIVYLRSTRANTPILYSREERFAVGGSKTLRSSDHDRATVIAAGITLHEALKAYAELERAGIAIRVIDLYSVKPIDRETLRAAARETGTIVTVEDHYPEGGLGEAVTGAIEGIQCEVRRLAVQELPRSGKPDELVDRYGIGVRGIVRAVRELLQA